MTSVPTTGILPRSTTITWQECSNTETKTRTCPHRIERGKSHKTADVRKKKKKGTIITPTPWSNPSSISILTTSGRAIDNTDNPEAAPEGVKYSNDRGRRKHENDRARKRNCGWAECAHSFRGSTHASKPFDLYIEVNVAERERKRERGKKRSFSMEIRKLYSIQLFKLCKLWEITSIECVEI